MILGIALRFLGIALGNPQKPKIKRLTLVLTNLCYCLLRNHIGSCRCTNRIQTWQGMLRVITQTISQHWQKPSLWTSQQRHPKGTRCPSWPRRCRLLPLLQGQWTLWLSWFCPPSWWGPLLTIRSRYRVRHPNIRCRTCWPLKSGSCSLLCKREMDKQSGNNKNHEKLHPLHPLHLQIGLHAVWSLHRLEIAARWPANCRTSSQGPVCWAPR